MNALTNTLRNTMSRLISEMLCAPVDGGQALVEMHLKQRILKGDSVPYTGKRRVKHTFLVRDQGQDITFEVAARVSAQQRTENASRKRPSRTMTRRQHP